MIFDEIVIGCGMAGLYWIYKTKPKNYLILEKSNRIGGRVYNIDWNGHQISLGGGIIKGDNEYTINLSKELGFELGSGVSKYEMTNWKNKLSESSLVEDNFYEINKKLIKYLKNIFNTNKDEINKNKFNFEEFLNMYVDLELVNHIKSNILYQTYFKGDVESVLYDEMSELLRSENFNIMFIKDGGYTKLLNKLIEIVGINNIKTNQNVIVITKDNDTQIFEIKTELDEIYKSKKIILATERNLIKYDFDNCEIENKIFKLYSMISGSCYIRIYSYHKSGHGLKLSCKTSGLPGKVIIINENILMCCYTEDLNAYKLNMLLYNKPINEQIEIIYKLLSMCSINISKPDDIIIKFWKIGVNYNNPKFNKEKKNKLIKNLVKENIIIIGECVSNSHGWVNSAFESVEFVLDQS
jgi:hypothetical protein